MGSLRVIVVGAAVLLLAMAGVGVWWLVADHDDTGCGSDAGPTALVAVGATSGDLLWTQRIGEDAGEDDGVQIVDGVVEVEARHHSSRLDVANGVVLSCIDHEPAEVQDVAALSTSRRVEGQVDPPPPLETVGVSAEWELQVAATGDVNRQERRVVVIDQATGAAAWEAVLPGYSTILLGDLVVAIDQTGGTGVLSLRSNSRVTAYEAATGRQRWQAPLPGAQWSAVAAGEKVIVAAGTEILALDRTTGEVVWRADHGSPGQDGDHSEPGEIRDLLATDDGAAVIAVVRAYRPYHD